MYNEGAKEPATFLLATHCKLESEPNTAVVRFGQQEKEKQCCGSQMTNSALKNWKKHLHFKETTEAMLCIKLRGVFDVRVAVSFVRCHTKKVSMPPADSDPKCSPRRPNRLITIYSLHTQQNVLTQNTYRSPLVIIRQIRIVTPIGFHPFEINLARLQVKLLQPSLGDAFICD